MNRKINRVVCNMAGSHNGCPGCAHYDEHDKYIEGMRHPCTIWADCQNWDTGELLKQRCVHLGRKGKIKYE